MPKFIGIKRLWYLDPLTEEPTQAGMADLITNATEIKNVHQDTWGYQQGDPEVTDYKNELTGKSYYRDKQDEGDKVINFTMGEFDYATKAALQGGSTVTGGWKAPTEMSFINKAFIALTKTGTYIVFTNASVVGKGDTQQKAIGLGITATAQESEVAGVSDEYWFDVVSS